MNIVRIYINIYSIVEVADIHNHHTDLVVEVLEVQGEEACVHQVDAVDIEDILVLLVVVDNSEEDIVDVRNVDHLEVDEECIPAAVLLVSVVRMSV